MKTSVFDCSVIALDRHHSQRKGDISVVENGITVPFDTKRVYYLYDELNFPYHIFYHNKDIYK